MQKLWDEVIKHLSAPLICLIAGFVAGLGAYKYMSGNLNADTVLQGSYIYKSDIEKSYVPIERFTATNQELQSTKTERDALKQENERLKGAQSAMTISVCQRYALEANAIMSAQQRAEENIQSILSPVILFGGRKTEEEAANDEKRIQELKRYSAELNQQIMQVRTEISKCAK